MHAQSWSGGCNCSKLRYTLKAEPMVVHCCHCTQCQRMTGSGFVINGVIETSNVEIETGSLKAFNLPSETGRKLIVYRCAECGTDIHTDYGGRETMIFVRMTTLDDPTRFGPDVHIFTRSKLPWISLPPQVPAYEAFYPTFEEVWTSEALQRRRALGF